MDKRIITCEILNNFPCISHGISKKIDAKNTFSMGFNHQYTQTNREIFCKLLGANSSNLVSQKQVHGNKVTVIDKQHAGKGSFFYETAIENSDALITQEKNIPLLALSADCPVLGFYDPKNNVIAVVHSGWKGTVKEISRKTIETFSKIFFSTPEDIIVIMAPSIGPCCYEVQDDFIQILENTYKKQCQFLSKRENRYYFNLWEANKYQLKAAGIKEKNIEQKKSVPTVVMIFFLIEKKETGRFALIMNIL